MVPRPDRPLQTWKTFVRNHTEGIASIDLFVVPTIAFQQLFAFLVLGHERRRLLWFAVTHNPTAEWLARQISEAFPWDSAQKYLIRDNDRAFGVAFKARVRAMGVRDRCFEPARGLQGDGDRIEGGKLGAEAVQAFRVAFDRKSFHPRAKAPHRAYLLRQ